MSAMLDSTEVQALTAEGAELAALIRVAPAQRTDNDFGGSLKVTSIQRDETTYVIAAELPRKLDTCTHCGGTNLTRHGRYVVRLGDLPYEDPTGLVMPVQIAIKSQRYKCNACGEGDVEPLPEPLTPVLTAAKITRRLSKWLLFKLQSKTPYETIARMTGYSTVWARKWYAEVRKQTSLPPKPANKPGRRKKTTL